MFIISAKVTHTEMKVSILIYHENIKFQTLSVLFLGMIRQFLTVIPMSKGIGKGGINILQTSVVKVVLHVPKKELNIEYLHCINFFRHLMHHALVMPYIECWALLYEPFVVERLVIFVLNWSSVVIDFNTKKRCLSGFRKLHSIEILEWVMF